MADPPLAAPLADIIEASGIPVPNDTPYSHITVALVAWNEQARLGKLLDRLRGYFETIAVVVQDSNDDTARVAREYADIFVTDRHHGFGDASFGPRLLPRIKTPWTFKVDCDEMPDHALLESLSSATWYAEANGLDGIWVPFKSWVDGIEYTEQHGHLRLFKTVLGWPPTLHSRPPTEQTAFWTTGHVWHERTLDEMMRDYLRYWRAGRGNPGWEDHNRLMMYWACLGTAAVKGWDYIRAFEWWPDVKAISFTQEQPWLTVSPALDGSPKGEGV